jgi:hypothetical protein
MFPVEVLIMFPGMKEELEVSLISIPRKRILLSRSLVSA